MEQDLQSQGRQKKANTRSSTESELIGVDDVIGFMEWTSLYCKDQVKEYPIKYPFKELGKKNLVKQDSTNTINMVKGGRRVCAARMSNIHI